MALVFDFDSISGSAQISFNVQTAKHVQSTAEGWAVLIGYSGTNFAELGIYSPVLSDSTDGRVNL